MIQNIAFSPWLDHMLWRHHAVNHPNGVSLFCPRWIIYIDSKNTRQFIFICYINTVPLCFLESRTLALRKRDISQMELLESRRMIFEQVGYRFDVLGDNVFSGDFLTRQVYPCWYKINKSRNFQADISWAGVYFTLRTNQIDFNSYMCLQGGSLQQLFIKCLLKKLKTFSICKYAKTVNLCSSYALVDSSLESRTPC